jgi:hypothetical protein
MPDWRATAFFSSRGWRTVLAVAILLILIRSLVFVFWPQSYFDSDQAVYGLMAKHISQGRAFPLFMYGQSYLLAVEAWLAAPVFLIAGVSVAALKFPLLIMNVVIALLLMRIFWREVGLSPPLTLVAALFFVFPAPGTSAELVAAAGANIEPFLYVTLLWLTRNRPNWGGLILGIGFLNREFTIYGLAALLVLEALHGVLFNREGLLRRAKMLRTAAEVFLLVTWLKQFSSAAGPGTSLADLYTREGNDNLHELLNRICIDPRTMLTGLWDGVTVHLSRLFGMAVEPLTEHSIDSGVGQGLPGGRLLLAAIAIIAIARIATRIGRERQWRPEYDPCAYFVLVGLLSFGANAMLRCGVIGVMRYDLLSIIGATGLAAFFLRAETSRPIVAIWTGLVMVWALGIGIAHARLLAEYTRHPPIGAKRMVIRHLEVQNIRYAYADYWFAYYISFLTNERIIVASTDTSRVAEYKKIVDAHRDQAIRITRTPCPEGHEIMRRVYFCSP